jgi:hypothetical protein
MPVLFPRITLPTWARWAAKVKLINFLFSTISSISEKGRYLISIILGCSTETPSVQGDTKINTPSGFKAKSPE